MRDDGFYISQILEGKPNQAIYKLVQKYQKPIFNLCFRILKNREVAEEIAQDSFLKSFKELSKLGDYTKYEIWLNRIAYHLSIDVTRKKKRLFTDIEDLSQFSGPNVASQDLTHQDRKNAIEDVLSKIPPEDAGLITLFYLNELNIKEVSEVTNLSESNVKVKLLRIRKNLKRQLNILFKEEIYDLY